MAKVVMFESFLKDFRVPFCEGLVEYLRPRGVDMQIVFGQPDRFHSHDSDIVQDLPCATRIRNQYFYFPGFSLVWHPVLKYVRGTDLVIVHQGNRHIANHVLLLLRRALGFGLAYFGHGRNFQHARPNCLAERFKRVYSRRADYWFAYNDKSKAVLRGIGVPEDRITAVQNAIDVTQLIKDYDSVSPAETQAIREELGISSDDLVGLYCGRFYRVKEMDFTLACAREIHRRDDRFHFVLIGDGVEAGNIRDFCRVNPSWAHYVGPRYGRDKAKYFKIAHCQLMPGAVGLSIVDSFAFLTPLITRDIPQHGPEIDYLKNGENGLMTPNSAEAYVDAVVGYIQDEDWRGRLVQGCLEARGQYTIENMVRRFGDGVCSALSQMGKM
jgi:L-malate glycosyltransferase